MSDKLTKKERITLLHLFRNFGKPHLAIGDFEVVATRSQRKRAWATNFLKSLVEKDLAVEYRTEGSRNVHYGISTMGVEVALEILGETKTQGSRPQNSTRS